MIIKELQDKKEKKMMAGQILNSLPEWFGIVQLCRHSKILYCPWLQAFGMLAGAVGSCRAVGSGQSLSDYGYGFGLRILSGLGWR